MALDLVARPFLGESFLLGGPGHHSATRLRALRSWAEGRLPPRAVVCDEAAAWVWVGGSPPERVCIRVAKVHRQGRSTVPPLRRRDGLPAASEIISFEGLRLTSPTRTALDLVADGAAEAQTIALLLSLADPDGTLLQAPLPPAQLLENLGRIRAAAVRRAWPGLRSVDTVRLSPGGSDAQAFR